MSEGGGADSRAFLTLARAIRAFVPRELAALTSRSGCSSNRRPASS
jgi:hypothetical protein